MRFTLTPDRWLGLAVMALALLIVFVWVPLDTGSGIAEKVRRKWEIGDALAPTVAGLLLMLAGALIAFGPRSDHPGLTPANLGWNIALLSGVALSIALMRWTGPAAATLLDAGDYRVLRDTAPWKYLGFVLGSTAFIGGTICLIERRLSLRRFLLAFAATAVIAAFYDLPFDDLLLPPNGDV